MIAKLTKLSTLVLALPALLVGAAFAQGEAYGGEAALLLFSGDDFQGEVREVFDPIGALPALAFNDRARSVAVLAGAWEVCEHSNFTGRCVYLRQDVSDLRTFRMSTNISSVRPIFEQTDAAHGLMFIRNRDGSIRYADQSFNGYDNYAYNDYNHGYQTSINLNVFHYGYSPDYRRHGYYHPRAGYGPYGFGYVRPGRSRVRYIHNPRAYSYGHNRYGGNRDRARHRGDVRGHHGARNGGATLYTDSRGRGASLGLNRGVRDLSRYRFNDNVSSIDIREGRWEVCEHANYKGRCEVIDASTGRLNGLRLNDNISSIRPVGGVTGRRGHRQDARSDRRNRGNGNDLNRRMPRNSDAIRVTRGNGADTNRPRLDRGANIGRRDGELVGGRQAGRADRERRARVDRNRTRQGGRDVRARQQPQQAVVPSPRARQRPHVQRRQQAQPQQQRRAERPVREARPKRPAAVREARQPKRPSPRSPAGIRSRNEVQID